MDSHNMDEILCSIESLSIDEQIDTLFDIIDKELEKEESKQNKQLIADCTNYIRQYDSEFKSASSAKEIQYIADTLAKEYQTQPRMSKKTRGSRYASKWTKVASVAAAILLVFGISIPVSAAANGLSIGEYLSFVIQNLKPGEDVDKDGFTFEYLGENKQYTDIKDVLSDQNLDIMYPSVLPDGVAIEKVYLTEAFSGEEKGELIVTFNDKDISCKIRNQNSVNIVPGNLEEYTTDYLVFYIQFIIPEKRYQAVAHSNGIEYKLLCNDYEQLVTLMKGFTK